MNAAKEANLWPLSLQLLDEALICCDSTWRFLQLCSLIYSWLMTAYDLTLSVRFTCSESSPTWSPSTLFWPGPEVLQFLLGDLGDFVWFCVVLCHNPSIHVTYKHRNAPDISLDHQNRKSHIAFPTCQSITLYIYIYIIYHIVYYIRIYIYKYVYIYMYIYVSLQ